MNRIEIIDTSLRDGLQHEEHYMSLEDRVSVIKALAEAGVKKLEIGSFAHPLYLPQFRDVDEFALMLPEIEGVEYTFLALNKKAIERAVALKAKGAPIHRVLTGQLATSAAYAKKNMNRTHEELFAEAKESLKMLRDGGIERVCGNVGTVWGCPIAGEIPLEKAYEFTDRIFDMGFDEIEHADTSGDASPDKVGEYFEEILRRYPDPKMHTIHIHDINGMGLACYYAAMKAGATQFECALGGVGGQPANVLDGVPVKGTGKYYYTYGRTGLVSTEDFAFMLDKMGIDDGVDLNKLISSGLEFEKMLGRNLDSFVTANAKNKL